MCRIPSDTATSPEPQQQKNPHLISTKSPHKNYICACVITTSLITIITILTLIVSQLLLMPVKDHTTPTTRNLVTREQWSALPPRSPIAQLQGPSKVVVISHTAGRYCETFESCCEMVQLIQKYHCATGDDIKYNFLIGADGNVYEGRGWRAKSFVLDSVSIAFIGNYVFDVVRDSMTKALADLLDDGVANGALDPDYKMVCQNQTMTTISPGRNVYMKMLTFSHYTPELLFSS